MRTPSNASAQCLPGDHREREATPSRLWQVPLFLAGVLALAWASALRPGPGESLARRLEDELSDARRALARIPPDVETALAKGEAALTDAERYPARAGEAHLLLGSARLVRASAASSDSGGWKDARSHLEQADSLGVPAADRDRLAYRLAKALLQTDGDPVRIVSLLEQANAAGAADEPAEGWGLLTRAYLGLPKPDLEKALKANERLLALPTLNESVLAPARLLRGELLLRLNRRDEARAVLANVHANAPAAIFASARLLRATICQEDERWADARGLWEEILRDERTPPDDPDRVRYLLGVCYAHLHMVNDALRAWEQAMAHGGATGQAAAFRQADLHVHEGNALAAVPFLERALADVGDEGPYHNALLGLTEARRICEETYQATRAQGHLMAARAVAILYAKVAPVPRGQEWVGEACDALARDQEGQAQRAKSPADAQRLTRAARGYQKEAAAAYEHAAGALQGQAAEAEWLCRSAATYTRAQDHARAASILQRLLRLPISDAQAAEAWYALARAFQLLGREGDARSAFMKCIEVDRTGPFAFRARYQLADAAIQAGKFDDAETGLKQNIELMGVAPDAEAEENTLLALAGLLFRRGNYHLAAAHLQQALDRYPSSPRALVARHVLADCYRRLADQERPAMVLGSRSTEDARLRGRDQYRFWLNRAAANYQKLKEDLTSRRADGSLPASQQAVLREAEFAEVECQFELGQYENVLRRCEELAERYRERADCMVAYKQMLRCYWTLSQAEKEPERRNELAEHARAVLRRARAALRALKDEAFPPETASETHDRTWWDRWLDWASKEW